jgi:hypothetical protein
MTSTAHTLVRGGRLRLAVAGAVVVTALTVATAGASPPTPMGGRAPAMTRPGTSPGQDPGASIPPDGFLLERGRFKPVTFPPGLPDPDPSPFDLNDRGQIVGYSVSGPTAATTFSGFLRDARGRLTAINRPGAVATAAFDINNRGQIVGVAPIADPAPSPPPTDPPPMGRMA